ncbi:hypothetical protein AAEO57_00165 [Flavobacterium sp. DGU38]|uniref:LlaJI restriction endonuclease n=1 Tax=Flavobacterium calami TaxID=3139144 RepID=A0ABU9IIA3_9FLAO
MSIATQIILPFSSIFPDETPKEVNEYLQGIPKEILMTAGCFFLGFNNFGSQYSDPENFIKMHLGSNSAQIEEATKNIKAFLAENGYVTETPTILFVVSSLRLFEIAFQLDERKQNKTQKQSELDIFKAYLVLNGKLSQRSQTISQIEQLFHGHKRTAANLLFNQFDRNDLINYNKSELYSTQLLRAVMFFEFLIQREDCYLLLQEFYRYFGVKDYKDYLKRLLTLAFAVITAENEAHTDIRLDDDAQVYFLDRLAINNIEIIDDFDFKAIRANPIYKVADGIYRIISPLFAIELIYNGLFWKFKEVYNQMPEHNRPKNLQGLKTLDFSEKYVLNSILRKYFGDRYIQKTGKELDGRYDGAPDYYVRNLDNIILFESKDIMINAEVKESLDFLKIQEALSEKLYKKANGKPNAVLQLIKSITKILSKKQGFDNDYSADEAIINSVIILHHRMFNNAGLNKFINFWFQEELQILKDQGFNITNVRPLVIIDIDTLIFNQDVFADRFLDLELCLREYQTNYIGYSPETNRNSNSNGYISTAYKNSFLPFSKYLENKISQMDLPPIPREVAVKHSQIFN